MHISDEINDLTYRIIGACMEVHRELGPGFPEDYYQKALEMELASQRIDFEPQVPLLIAYKGAQIGLCYLDFLVEQKVIVEIKSVRLLDDIHRAQVMKYLTASDYKVALLINFGAASLQQERILPPQKIQNFKRNKNRTADLTD